MQCSTATRVTGKGVAESTIEIVHALHTRRAPCCRVISPPGPGLSAGSARHVGVFRLLRYVSCTYLSSTCEYGNASRRKGSDHGPAHHARTDHDQDFPEPARAVVVALQSRTVRGARAPLRRRDPRDDSVVSGSMGLTPLVTCRPTPERAARRPY